MTTQQAFETIAPVFHTDDLAVCTLGRTAESAYKHLPSNQVLFLDCMGSVIGTAIGVAMGVSSTVYAFESDGSFMYSLSILQTIKENERRLKNLRIIIFDNCKLESGGGWKSRSIDLSWSLLFTSFGLSCSEIKDYSLFSTWLNNESDVVNIAILQIDNENELSSCTKDIDGIESKYLVKRFINNTKKGIIKPCIKN